jgi:hypothetical protein
LAGDVKRLQDVGLYFDVDESNNIREQTDTIDPPTQLSEPLIVLCNDVERDLKKVNYAYRGDVYEQHNQAKFTYCQLRYMESFLDSLLGNPRLLSLTPKLQAISQIYIDHDLVEVNGGTCWSFRRRQFLQQPIQQSDVGRVSPRAFTCHNPNQEADPRSGKGKW